MENTLTEEVDFGNDRCIDLINFVLKSNERSGVKIVQIHEIISNNLSMMNDLSKKRLIEFTMEYKNSLNKL